MFSSAYFAKELRVYLNLSAVSNQCALIRPPSKHPLCRGRCIYIYTCKHLDSVTNRVEKLKAVVLIRTGHHPTISRLSDDLAQKISKLE